jgi:hypothetical protein
MRVMLRARIPVETGNQAISDRSIQQKMQSIMETLKPEAAYFVPDGGQRTALFFFDMQDSSQLVTTSEPLFMGLNASVEVMPAMNADDLQRGMSALG